MTSDTIGIIADDFTGATDIGGLLARTMSGVHLHTRFSPASQLGKARAHIVALKIRTEPVEDAVSQALAAFESLRRAGASRFFWKYCSTFDSTSKGNIGPVSEALLRALNQPYAVYCPAFPENGRTVRGGRLFVNGVPLADSPMKDHPLTPMRESDLVRVLAPQVTGKVAWLGETAPGLREKAEKMSRQGISHFILDAGTHEDIGILGREFSGLPFLTGSSAFAAAAYGQCSGGTSGHPPVPGPVLKGSALILSGSCSQATRNQVAQFRGHGGHVIEIDPLTLDAESEARLAREMLARLGTAPVLVTSTTEPDRLKAIQDELGQETISQRIEQCMARMAVAARHAGTTRYVVAGGETSGAVTKGLGISRLDIRNEIAPGVPWCLSEDQSGHLALALKSGNFGGPDFFLDAFDALEGKPRCTS